MTRRGGRRPGAVIARSVAAAAAAGLAAWAGWIEPRRLVVRRTALALPRWPAALAGVRVGVMTDFHGGVPHAGEDVFARWVAAMNAERPDLILLGGDFADAHVLFGGRLSPRRMTAHLAGLRAPLGVYAVLGNHDWKQFGWGMYDALARTPIVLLENSSVPVNAPGGRFHVAGLGDLRMRSADIGAALRAVPPGEPVVLLSHDPDVFPRVPERVALTVAGHTHGGQVAIPLVRRPVVPSSYGERYVRGHVVEGGRHLIVSSGLGTSGAPVRLLAPPELLVLELRPG